MSFRAKNFVKKSLGWFFDTIDWVFNFFTKHSRDNHFYDQHIPLQSIFRTQLEYPLTRYNTHEVYSADIDDSHPAHQTRQLRLVYDPQIIPQPYYFYIDNAVTFRNETIDPKNPKRLFLEKNPETTLIEEGVNYPFSIKDKIRAKIFYVRNKYNEHDLGYLFTGPWVNNYFHFLIDYSLKYNELAGSGVITQEYDIIYHNKMRSWQSIYYDLLGIDSNRLVGSRNTPMRVNRLLISSNQRHRFAVSNSAIQGLKNTIFTRLEMEQKKPRKRLYLSRRTAKVRRILNEDEVISRLEAQGFQAVQPETLTIPDQIKLFSEAEAIVAPHGAGLTNMIFAASPKIIELIPADLFKFGYFIGLTNSIGGQHYPLICEPENEKQDFRVSLKHLDEVLKQL